MTQVSRWHHNHEKLPSMQRVKWNFLFQELLNWTWTICRCRRSGLVPATWNRSLTFQWDTPPSRLCPCLNRKDSEVSGLSIMKWMGCENWLWVVSLCCIVLSSHIVAIIPNNILFLSMDIAHGYTSSGIHGKPGKSLKKFHALKNHGIWKHLNIHGKFMEFCEIMTKPPVARKLAAGHLCVRQLVFWLLVVSSFIYFKMHAWSIKHFVFAAFHIYAQRGKVAAKWEGWSLCIK